MISRFVVLLLAFSNLWLAACSGAIQRSATPVSTTIPADTPTFAGLPSRVPSASPTQPSGTETLVLPTRAPAAPTLTPVAVRSPTQNPYAGLYIDDLASRQYGGGQLQVKQVLAVTDAFTRTLVTYPSDGLTIYGFMDVPKGRGPFPVVLVLHGFVNTAGYNTLTYTASYADALARAGFLVIHPNYRGYPPSDDGPNLFRVGFAVDVLNLLAIVRQQGGKGGALRNARSDSIGIWGHSMGGGIVQRVLTVDPSVRAAVLYAAMSGDEEANYAKIAQWRGGGRSLPELEAPASVVRRISPVNYLDRIRTPVSIHHGTSDGTVPLQWSLDLCKELTALQKSVECFTYPGQSHTFVGEMNNLFIQRTVAFLKEYIDRP